MLDLIVVCECMFQISRASVYIRKVSSEFSGMNLIAIVIEGHDKSHQRHIPGLHLSPPDKWPREKNVGSVAKHAMLMLG